LEEQQQEEEDEAEDDRDHLTLKVKTGFFLLADHQHHYKFPPDFVSVSGVLLSLIIFYDFCLVFLFPLIHVHVFVVAVVCCRQFHNWKSPMLPQKSCQRVAQSKFSFPKKLRLSTQQIRFDFRGRRNLESLLVLLGGGGSG